ncbi:Protein root UVB sensitive 4 [Linum perenne]
MQSALFSSASSRQLCFPWKSDEFHQNPVSQKLNFPPRCFTLRTSINYGPEEGVDNGPSERESIPKLVSPAKLPVAVRKSGRVSRYIWDGSCLSLESVDGSGGAAAAAALRFDFEDGFWTLFRVSSSAVRDVFVPKRVTNNYLQYVKWKLLHRVFSSALQVLATQAMFRAIGIGFSRSLPSTAAFNWVLKEGLGRLCRCIYTASLASAFDTNLKRVRFLTSVVFSLSIGVELLTPIFPQYFLLLATLANIAKQISLACYLATSSAVHRSFAVADNLGEISAKAQIQSVCFDTLGLLFAATLDTLFKNNQTLLKRLPFIVYPIFAAIDVFGIYQGLKHVHLQTLTKDRLEIILDTWIKVGHVPSPAEVSKKEGVGIFRSKTEKESWPIRIGCLTVDRHIPKLSMMAMQSLGSEDYYVICVENSCGGFVQTKQPGIVLFLREGAGTTDVTMGLLQACYIRRALVVSSRWAIAVGDINTSDLAAREWRKLLEETKITAAKNLSLIDDQMTEVGWAVKNILLGSGEQVRYSFIDDLNQADRGRSISCS